MNFSPLVRPRIHSDDRDDRARNNMGFRRLLAAAALVVLAWASRRRAQVPSAPQVGATSYVLMDFHSGKCLPKRSPICAWSRPASPS